LKSFWVLTVLLSLIAIATLDNNAPVQITEEAAIAESLAVSTAEEYENDYELVTFNSNILSRISGLVHSTLSAKNYTYQLSAEATTIGIR